MRWLIAVLALEIVGALSWTGTGGRAPQQAEGDIPLVNLSTSSGIRDFLEHPPQVTKTGTTIVGLIYEGGVILGADTRATDGSTVADKNCSKVHALSSHIYCCGAGTAADCDQVTSNVSRALTQHAKLAQAAYPFTSSVSTTAEAQKQHCRVALALNMLKRTLYKHHGQVGASLILGGVDSTGSHLFTVQPHGSSDRVPYAALGSGSLAALSLMEMQYKIGLSEEEALSLVSDAVGAGISNDLGSGSNVDMCIIRYCEDSVDYRRGYRGGEGRKKGQGKN